MGHGLDSELNTEIVNVEDIKMIVNQAATDWGKADDGARSLAVRLNAGEVINYNEAETIDERVWHSLQKQFDLKDEGFGYYIENPGDNEFSMHQSSFNINFK